MPDLIFRQGAAHGEGVITLLRDMFGVPASPVGNDVVVAEADCPRFAPREALTLHPQIRIDEEHYLQVAAEMQAQIPADLQAHQPPPPERLVVSEAYGTLSQIDRATNELAAVPNNRVAQKLAHAVLPLMKTKFEAKFVTGITVDADGQQSWLSFTKLILLGELYGVANVQSLLTRRAMEGALPHALDYLSYPDILTRFAPMAMTLPVRRNGCSWHFQGDAMWAFHHAPVDGIMGKFMQPPNPLSRASATMGFYGLRGMSEQNIWRYLRLVVDAVNRLLAFANDPRNFVRPDGSVDTLKKVQFYTAVRFLFADLAGLNFNLSAYNRLSYGMSAMDKLANIRRQVGGHVTAESDVMANLAGEVQRDWLKTTIRAGCRRRMYDDLAQNLEIVVDRCYTDLHAELGAQDAAAATSEAKRLARIRMQRNLRHGPFLGRQQFDSLFLESDGTISATYATLPLLLTLGLALDPAGFIALNPLPVN